MGEIWSVLDECLVIVTETSKVDHFELELIPFFDIQVILSLIALADYYVAGLDVVMIKISVSQEENKAQ